MTGRDRMMEALSPAGTGGFPAAICYEGIFYRDHWDEVTSCPWWYVHEADVARQARWRGEAAAFTAQDWFHLPLGADAAAQSGTEVIGDGDSAEWVDRATGRRAPLGRPKVGGGGTFAWDIGPSRVRSREDVDAAMGPAEPPHSSTGADDGRHDLPRRLISRECAGLAPYTHIDSPLYACHRLWGYHGFMTALVDDPDLVRYACGKHCERSGRHIEEAAAMGSEIVWIEECLLDAVSPDTYMALCVPYAASLIDAIRGAGMRSVYYYCGDPKGRLGMLVGAGPDAIALEEGKKGFRIDIGEVADFVAGRCALFGNVDAIWLLPDCSERELRLELRRQAEAGRRNKGRFVHGIGSPVTPGTPAAKVRLFCEMAHEVR